MGCSDAVRNPSTWGFLIASCTFAILMVSAATPWYQETYYTGTISEFIDLPANFINFRYNFRAITCRQQGNIGQALNMFLPDSWACDANHLWRTECVQTVPLLPLPANGSCGDIITHWNIQIGLTVLSVILAGFCWIFFMLRASVNSCINRSILHIIVSVMGFVFILAAVAHFPYKYNKAFDATYNCSQLTALKIGKVGGCSDTPWGVNVPVNTALNASWGPSVGFFIGVASVVLFFFSMIWSMVSYQLPVKGGEPVAAPEMVAIVA